MSLDPATLRWIRRAQQLLRECPPGLNLYAMEHVLYAAGPGAQAVIGDDDPVTASMRGLQTHPEWVTLGNIVSSGGW